MTVVVALKIGKFMFLHEEFCVLRLTRDMKHYPELKGYLPDVTPGTCVRAVNPRNAGCRRSC